MITQADFERLVDKSLIGTFYPSAKRTNPTEAEQARGARKKASFVNPQVLRLYLEQPNGAPCRVFLRRAQYWTEDDRSLAWAFLDTVGEIAPAIGSPFELEVISSLPLRVVARLYGEALYEPLFEVLSRLVEWSAESYEGHARIAVCGIDPSVDDGEVTGEELWSESYAPTLTNGLDTMLVFACNGRLYSRVALPYVPDTDSASGIFAPLRFVPVARWANEGRVAVVLTRTGDILVFSDGILAFAKRGAKWTRYDPVATVRLLGEPRFPALREAILASCIDASYAGHGACLGIALIGRSEKVRDIVDVEDRREGIGVKATVLKMVAGGPFHKLDRRLRLDLMRMDGATVLDHHGRVLASGAIVKIAPGSTGGGRQAAARQLGSELGVGIKVSQDGPIKVFKWGDDPFVLG